MFERVKCYKTLRKQENFLRGGKVLGELTQDEELIRKADDALRAISVLKKRMWLSRKLAKKYNSEALKIGCQ